MLSLYRTLSFRYLRHRWSRATLIVISIALGVGILVATRLLSQSMTKAARVIANPLADIADLHVTNSDFGVDSRVVDDLVQARISGLRQVRAVVLGQVALLDLNNRSAALLGVSFDVDQTADNPLGIERHLTDPLSLLKSWPAFVGSELAKTLPGGIGTIRVRSAGSEYRVSGAGTVDAHGPAASLGGNILVMRIQEAARLLGQPDLVTRIDLVLEPGADREPIRQRAQEVVAGRGEVRTPEANDQALHDIMGGLELSFDLGGIEALVVGLFLVYNALSVSVAERRHDIGVMRSLGATRGQIGRLFAGEAGLLGLTGAAVGLPLGAGLAYFALGPIERVLSEIFVPLEARRVELTLPIVVGALIAGVLTALLAALVPAMQAALQEPAEVVRRVPRAPSLIYRVLQATTAILIIGAGLVCMTLREWTLLRAWLPERAGTFGAIVLVLLGALAASPLLAGIAAHLFQPVVRLILGIEGRLAADNLARSSGRTGLVVAAVGAVVALVLETAGLTLSSEDAIYRWIDDSIAADLFVTANSPITSGAPNLPMQERVGQRIAALPEVEAVLPIRFQHVFFRDKLVCLIAFDAVNYSQITPERVPARRREMYARMCKPGTAVVSDNFAALHKVKEGDDIVLQGPRGPLPLRVVGTLVDYTWNRGTILMDRQLYRQHFQDDLVDVFDVYVRRSADPHAIETFREAVLRRWGAEEALVMLTRDELQQNISAIIRRLYGMLYAQEAVVALVSTLGIVSALLISVLQRRRELGLLRAVGASRAQVLRSVLAEATLMGLIGALVGLAIGIPLEWYAVHVILLDESGFVFPVLIPWQSAVLLVSVSLVVATLAGLGPALHAMRLRIPEAIAYE
jgi:putative ABC transport system permease protein